MIGIFIDDERDLEAAFWMVYPEGIEWTILNNDDDKNCAKKFLELLPDVIKNVDVMSFDHDLHSYIGNNEVTGYDLLKRMIDLCLELDVQIPECYFHSKNPVGIKNMRQYYENAVEFQNRQHEEGKV